MDTGSIICVILIMVVMPVLMLGILIPTEKEKRRICGDTVNHDWMHARFVYKVSMTRELVLQTLATHHEIDMLSCTIDIPQSTIVFSRYGDSKEYFFLIQEDGDSSVVMLKAVYPFGMQSQVPSFLNPFMVQKLNATLLPYSQYADLFWA